MTELIAQGENTTLEFKSTLGSAAKIAKTLVAFANTNGGILLVGVTDDKRICGIASEEAEMSKIEEAADRYCEPPVTVSYKMVSVQGANVLAVSILESEEKPHTVHEPGKNPVVYVRMHNKSVPAGKLATRQLSQNPTTVNKALLQSPNVKSLLAYLQSNEYITAKRYAKLINISERRAAKLLMDLASNQLLMPVEHGKEVAYALK